MRWRKPSSRRATSTASSSIRPTGSMRFHTELTEQLGSANFGKSLCDFPLVGGLMVRPGRQQGPLGRVPRPVQERHRGRRWNLAVVLAPHADRPLGSRPLRVHLPQPRADLDGVRVSLRPPPAGAGRDGDAAAHAGVRHHQRATGGHRRGGPQARRAQRAGPAPHADHRRRRAELEDDRRAAPPARLLLHRGRRLRVHRHLGGAREGCRPGAGLGSRFRPGAVPSSTWVTSAAGPTASSTSCARWGRSPPSRPSRRPDLARRTWTSPS